MGGQDISGSKVRSLQEPLTLFIFLLLGADKGEVSTSTSLSHISHPEGIR